MQPSYQQLYRARLASNLLFGSFLASQVLFYYGLLILHRPVFSDQTTNPWVTIPLNILTLGWYYAIRQGKQWAKILLLIIVGSTLASILITHRKVVILAHMSADGLYAARFVISYTIYLIALGLLFYKPRPISTSV
jgi:hypothetical protein